MGERLLPDPASVGKAMTDPRFVLNVNDGEDVIHDANNLTESCNTDDIEGKQRVDVRTASSMIASGHARTCQHCIPSEAT